ncbi:hypothetical protein ACWCXH_10470 [Kitasatospora sp. NPDC001660]
MVFSATTVVAGIVVTFLPLAVPASQTGLIALALFARPRQPQSPAGRRAGTVTGAAPPLWSTGALAFGWLVGRIGYAWAFTLTGAAMLTVLAPAWRDRQATARAGSNAAAPMSPPLR